MASRIALDITLGVESQHKNLEIVVTRPHKDIELVVEKSLFPPREYPGPYVVRPRLYVGHLLETRSKMMTDNVTVDPIPIVTTRNPYGGQTVVIG